MELSEKMKEELSEKYQEKLEQAEDIKQVKILDTGLSFFETDLKKGETYPMPCDIAESINDGQNAKIVEERQIEEITEGQNKKIHALYDKLDWGEDKKKAILDKQFDVDHTNELSKEQAGELIDILNRQYARKDKKERGEVALPDTMKLPPGEAGQQAALKMEKRDDAQIATEVSQIPEKAVEDWFYQFTQETEEGKKYTVTGLSYVGVMALMRKQENIDVKVLENKDEGGHFKVKARAVDKARNITFERTKRQPKKMELKSGEKKEDEFADVKAESKVIKKCLEAVISPRVVVRAYEQWQKQKGKR